MTALTVMFMAVVEMSASSCIESKMILVGRRKQMLHIIIFKMILVIFNRIE